MLARRNKNKSFREHDEHQDRRAEDNHSEGCQDRHDRGHDRVRLSGPDHVDLRERDRGLGFDLHDKLVAVVGDTVGPAPVGFAGHCLDDIDVVVLRYSQVPLKVHTPHLVLPEDLVPQDIAGFLFGKFDGLARLHKYANDQGILRRPPDYVLRRASYRFTDMDRARDEQLKKGQDDDHRNGSSVLHV